MNRQEFDKLAESKQYAYHRRHYPTVREIEASLRTAERNIIRDMSKYMPPNVSDPKAWMRQNAGPDALGNLRKKATELQEPQRSRWLANLDKPSWRAQITNRTALYKRIEMEGLTTQRSIDRTLGTALRGAAAEGYARQMFEVQKGAGIGWAFDLPNTRQADAMVRRVLNTKYTSNLTKRHSAAIKEQITGGILSGSSVNDIAKQINRIAGNEIWEAKRLVRTEITGAAAEGELEALRDMEEEFGIKMRYRFYATLDERTCPVCGALDMQDFSPDDAEEGVNKPPMHPNCRCVIQPVMDDEKKEEIVRRGRDESGKSVVMPKGMTYEKWKEEYVRKPKAVPERDIAKELEKSAAGVGYYMGGSKLPETPYIKPFAKADDYKDLVETAKGKYKLDLIDANKADFSLLRDSMENLSKTIDKNQWAASDLRTVRVVDSIDGDAYAQCIIVEKDGKYFTEIQLNKDWYENREMLEDVVDFKVKNGDFVEGTTADNLIVHEFGHNMHISASKKMGVLDGVTDINDAKMVTAADTRKIIAEIATEMNMEISSNEWRFFVSDNISKYGSTFPWEAIAESYNAVDINTEDKVSELCKKIFKRYKDILTDG